MLQTVATIISLLLAFGATAIIWASIADDWEALCSALGRTSPTRGSALPPHVHARPTRPARVVRINSRAVPLRAAA